MPDNVTSHLPHADKLEAAIGHLPPLAQVYALIGQVHFLVKKYPDDETLRHFVKNHLAQEVSNEGE